MRYFSITQSGSKTRAFTLIELLVVIAIIAILAAILFPVFAQAKLAAKRSASLSNSKQIGTSIQMYNTDYDDNYPVWGSWGSLDPDAWKEYDNFSSWVLAVYPYVKNGGIWGSPLQGSLVKSGETDRLAASRYTTYGYNYTYLCPTPSTVSLANPQPISSTAVGNPAETVLLVERTGRENYDDKPVKKPPKEGHPGTIVYWLTVATAEAPDCATARASKQIDIDCADGWGVGSVYNDYLKNGEDNGAFTGGIPFKKRGAEGGITVAWTDGHSKYVSAGALANGTNWNYKSRMSDVFVTDPSKYVWDAN